MVGSTNIDQLLGCIKILSVYFITTKESHLWTDCTAQIQGVMGVIDNKTNIWVKNTILIKCLCYLQWKTGRLLTRNKANISASRHSGILNIKHKARVFLQMFLQVNWNKSKSLLPSNFWTKTDIGYWQEESPRGINKSGTMLSWKGSAV